MKSTWTLAAQHSRGFTVYKMIIDSKVLVLPGSIRPEWATPARSSALQHPGENGKMKKSVWNLWLCYKSLFREKKLLTRQNLASIAIWWKSVVKIWVNEILTLDNVDCNVRSGPVMVLSESISEPCVECCYNRNNGRDPQIWSNWSYPCSFVG